MTPDFRFDADVRGVYERQCAASNPGWRADTTAWFERQLSYIRPELYEEEFEKLVFRELLPVENLPYGPSRYLTQRITKYGEAHDATRLSNVAPRVDVGVEEDYIEPAPLQAAYGWTVDEIVKAQYEGMSLSTVKAQAAAEAIERGLDRIAFEGSPIKNRQGLLNLTGTLAYTLALGDLGSAAWLNPLDGSPQKTPDEIVADMVGIVLHVFRTTLEIEMPDTLLLPTKEYDYVATTRMGDASDKTILMHFRAIMSERQMPINVRSHRRLDTAGAGGAPQMIAYVNDRSRISLVIPQEFTQMQPQLRGFEWVTNCMAETAGIDLKRPQSVAKADFVEP